MDFVQKKLRSKLGPLFWVASDKRKESSSHCNKNRILSKASEQIEEYLDGDRTEFDLPLDIQGTQFQLQVWKRLLEIPYGQTDSYQVFSARLNRATATRAVGTANGKNPLCLIIPCHRVISANGTLGGYSGGLKIKAKLLKIEKRKESKM